MDLASHEVPHGSVDESMALDQWLTLEICRNDEGCEMGPGLGMTGMEVGIVLQLKVGGCQACGEALAKYVGGSHGHVWQR